MIAKIAIITGLVIGYLLIGFLLLFIINKLNVLRNDDLLIDDTLGVIFALFYPLAIPIIIISVLMYEAESVVEWINDKALDYYSEYEEEDNENT